VDTLDWEIMKKRLVRQFALAYERWAPDSVLFTRFVLLMPRQISKEGLTCADYYRLKALNTPNIEPVVPPPPPSGPTYLPPWVPTWTSADELTTLAADASVCVSSTNTSLVYNGHLLDATFVTGYRDPSNTVS
jgi:hypothetical protein